MSLKNKELEKVVNAFRFVPKVWFCIADINHTHTDGKDGVIALFNQLKRYIRKTVY
ncbi:hypothetical protein AGMMS49921_06840 [Endomicrobiia bacterium]|nr:hypothetical protein AGMMS49921_06840 [Endomicrobiia bacterium]